MMIRRKISPVFRGNLRKTNLLILLFGIVLLILPEGELASDPPPKEDGPIDYLGQLPPGQVPERFAPGIIRLAGAIHGSIAFSPDASEIYWTLWNSNSLNNPPKILYVKRSDSGWTEPAAVFANDAHGAGEISISPSGDRLYFSSRRPLPPDWGYQLQRGTREWGVGKIWYSDKDAGIWGKPQILEERINKDLNGVSATLDGTLYSSGLRRIRQTVDGWGQIEWLSPPLDITTPGGQFKGGHPFVATDESFVIFNDDWPGHRGYGIFVSFRDSTDNWSQPVNILDEMGIERGGSVPVLSPDGKYLFYYAAGDFWWVDASIITLLKEGTSE